MKRRLLGSIAFGGLTPLVDTLFLLLFALLALSESPSEDQDESVHVQLPSVEAAVEAAPSLALRVAIEIGADAGVRLAGHGSDVGSREALDRALALEIGDALPEEVAIELRADRMAPHGVAVELLQHLRLRGFVHVELLATGDATGSGPFGPYGPYGSDGSDRESER